MTTFPFVPQVLTTEKKIKDKIKQQDSDNNNEK
jgi:hypothetical protein